MYFPYKSLKYLTLLGKWWCMPLIPELKRQKQAIWVQGQPGPHSKFQVSRATQRNPISIERKSRIWETLWGKKKNLQKSLMLFFSVSHHYHLAILLSHLSRPSKKSYFSYKKIIYSFIYLFLRKYLCFPGSLGLRNLVASVSLLECITISGTQKVTELQTHTHLCSCLGLSTLNLTFLSLYYILSAKVTQPCQYGWCCLKNQHQNLIHILQYKSLYTSFLYSYSTIS